MSRKKISNISPVAKESEPILQSKICQYLAREKIFFFSVPNEAMGRINFVRMARLKAMGLRPGASDLVILMPGVSIFVEVKTSKGRQSDNQKDFQSRVESLGFKYFVVRSVDDMRKVLHDVRTEI